MEKSTQRPLSPHLQIYKPQMTSMMSIFHRITGMALTFGLLLFSAWLWTAAFDPESYKTVTAFTNHPVGMIMLFGWSVAFFYHLANGIRHLVWDTTHMLELSDAYKAGYMVLGFTLFATLGTWALILMEA